MRFRGLTSRRPTARASIASSPVAPPTPQPPPPRAVLWRSLWVRVHARWTAAPTTATTATRVSLSTADPAQELTPTSQGPPTTLPAAPHRGLRAYLQRKRGELWFLTKRRHDSDLQSADDSEEIEVPPPPRSHLGNEGGRSTKPPKLQPLRSLLSANVDEHSRTNSEIEIDMSSYSASSDGLDDDDDGAASATSDTANRDEDDGDEASEDDDEEDARDSYETAPPGDSDPFLQRYSSWCSIDDEQTASARASDASEQLELADCRSPTLEELYEVRYVDIGGTPTPIAGIWI